MCKWLCILFILFNNAYASNNWQVPENPTISQIEKKIREDEVSCEQLIISYINRIKQYNLNLNAPSINAITEINQNAVYEAAKKDALYSSTGKMPGKLFCIPVIVKDNIDVIGMSTTSGSYALLGTKPIRNSDIVDRLMSENAIIIAKSSMDELAMGMSGYSSRSGRIGNAYNTSKNPGGSSGGSAAAVSANLAVIGIGTDNSGSIRIPAGFNGVYGLRPTQGLISKSGIFPMGNLDGTAGPIARNMTDLALTLEAISGESSNYHKFLNTPSLSGKKLAILHLVGKYDVWKNMPNDIKNLYLNAINNLQKSGVTIVNIDLPNFNNLRNYNIAGTNDDVNAYLSENLSTRANMTEICNSNRTIVMGAQKKCQNFISSIPNKKSLQYKQAQNNILKNKSYLKTIFEEQHLDGLILNIS